MKIHQYFFGPIITCSWLLLAMMWSYDSGKDFFVVLLSALVGLTMGILVSFAIEYMAIKLRELRQKSK